MKHQAWTRLAVPRCYLMPSFIFQPSWREILMKMHWSLNQTAEASRCAISINSHKPAKLLSIFAMGRRKERALGYYPKELIQDACNVYTKEWPYVGTATKQGECSGERVPANESDTLSFSHLSLTASPLPQCQGKTQPVVVYSLDGGPFWPPSGNFRLHVICAREPAPAIIQGHPVFFFFSLFYFGDWKPTCFQALCCAVLWRLTCRAARLSDKLRLWRCPLWPFLCDIDSYMHSNCTDNTKTAF